MCVCASVARVETALFRFLLLSADLGSGLNSALLPKEFCDGLL